MFQFLSTLSKMLENLWFSNYLIHTGCSFTKEKSFYSSCHQVKVRRALMLFNNVFVVKGAVTIDFVLYAIVPF